MSPDSTRIKYFSVCSYAVLAQFIFVRVEEFTHSADTSVADALIELLLSLSTLQRIATRKSTPTAPPLNLSPIPSYALISINCHSPHISSFFDPSSREERATITDHVLLAEFYQNSGHNIRVKM
jgi:hypothetical protein